MKILFAIDGSAVALQAVQEVRRLLPMQGVEAHLVDVTDSSEIVASYQGTGVGVNTVIAAEVDRARCNLKEARVLLDASGAIVTSHVSEGFVPAQILAMAEDLDPDLVVLGSHGYNALKRFIVGSVSDEVVHGWPGNILVIKSARLDEAPLQTFGIVASFATRDRLEQALVCLRDRGIGVEQLSVLARGSDRLATERVPVTDPTPRATEELALSLGAGDHAELLGALVGTYAGLCGGLAMLAVPGFGTLVLAGGTAALLAETIGASVAGLGLGAVLGDLLNAQHVEKHRDQFEQTLASGGYLLSFRGTEQEFVETSRILKEGLPSHVDYILE